MASPQAGKPATPTTQKPAPGSKEAGFGASTDWERIEFDYRAGILSLREIAASQDVSHQAIAKRAKSAGWDRDIGAKVKAKAEALVAKSLVDTSVDSKRVATEKEVIDAGANAIVQVKLSHRKDISRSRAIVMSLFDELELTCGPENAALLEDLGEIMRDPDEKGQDKRADLYAKLLSLNGRSVTMKNLGESLKTMIGLEREAYSLDDPKAAAEQGQGAQASSMTDAERAIRMSRLINGNPGALAAFLAVKSKAAAE